MAFISANILDYVGYTLPLIGAFTVATRHNDWANGDLIHMYRQVMGGGSGTLWIGIMIVVGAWASSFGLYVVEMSAQARTIWACAQPFIVIDDTTGKIFIPGEVELEDPDDGETALPPPQERNDRYMRVGILPTWTGKIWKRTNVPWVGVLIQTIVSLLAVFVGFDFLVECSSFFSCFTFLFEFGAFLLLRYKEPNAPRPFKGGGIKTAWLITICKYMLVLAVFVGTAVDQPIIFVISIGLNLLAVAFFYGRIEYWKRYGDQTADNILAELREQGHEFEMVDHKADSSFRLLSKKMDPNNVRMHEFSSSGDASIEGVAVDLDRSSPTTPVQTGDGNRGQKSEKPDGSTRKKKRGYGRLSGEESD